VIQFPPALTIPGVDIMIDVDDAVVGLESTAGDAR
jgi:hypothetical protein